MKHILIFLILLSGLLASPIDLSTFKANFTQNITDEKNKVLTYKGDIIASDKQKALWRYSFPIKKLVYLNKNKVTIVEPEIEQVIIKYVKSNFNFFNMLKNSKKISNNKYLAKFNGVDFTITTADKKIESINYLDNFENKVKIIFQNQKQNIKIDNNNFVPKYDLDFDVIRD